MIRWLLSIFAQLKAGLPFQSAPAFRWGVTLHDIDPSQYARFRRIYAEQVAAVEAIDPSAVVHRDPTACRWATYTGTRFPAPNRATAWGLYFPESRLIVIQQRFVDRDDLLAHEIRHDILHTEAHPSRFFNSSSLEMPK